MNAEKLVSILKKNIIPAFGCTDPITPALAAAIAYHESGKGTVQETSLIVSNDIYKGAYSVIVPGTDKKGIPFAVALGIACGIPELGLMVLEGCDEESILLANQILENSVINVTPDSTKGEIYVELSMLTSSGSARVIFDGRHDTYSYLEVNGSVKENQNSVVNNYGADFGNEIPASIQELCELVESLGENDLAFIQEGIDMNEKASEVGLLSELKEATAQSLSKALRHENNISYFSTKIHSCAASDARMGGCAVPVMSVFGSGNQGVLIFCSLSHLGGLLGKEKIKILRAIALTSLIAGQFNKELAEGTPFCDCALVASSATAAGMAYLMDANAVQIENAIQMTISCMAGLICDGAKPNCSQKISLGVGAALENALISRTRQEPVAADGVLGKTYLDSCKNIYRLGKSVRVIMEQDIVTILGEKEGRC